MSCRTKIATLARTIWRVKNWPSAVKHSIAAPSREVCRLSFREGLEVSYRPDTEDWEVVKEVMLFGVYALCLEHLARQKDNLPVLDLGANIGLFSLRAAHSRPGIDVHAYEPAHRNIRMNSANLVISGNCRRPANTRWPGQDGHRRRRIRGSPAHARQHLEKGARAFDRAAR